MIKPIIDLAGLADHLIGRKLMAEKMMGPKEYQNRMMREARIARNKAVIDKVTAKPPRKRAKRRRKIS